MGSGSGAITNVEHWSRRKTGAGVTRQLRPLVKRLSSAVSRLLAQKSTLDFNNVIGVYFKQVSET